MNKKYIIINLIIIILFFIFNKLNGEINKGKKTVNENIQDSNKKIILEDNLSSIQNDYIQDNITLVSAFYIINSKHPLYYYIVKLNNLFKLNASIIFFTEKAFMKIAKNLRPKNLYYKTVFIELEIKDFFSYKKFGKRFKEAFKLDFQNRFQTIPLYIVWAEKCNFVRKAIINNYFNSTCFYWIDSGWFRDSKEINRFINGWPSPDICYRDNRVLVNLVGNFSSTEIKKIREFNIKSIKKLLRVLNTASGMFGGQKAKLIKFIELYYQAIIKFDQNKLFIGKEQNIFAYISFKYPEIVKLISTNGDYFYFKKYLHKII